MSMKFCVPCGGSGKMMGGGMLAVNCSQCSGMGKMESVDDDIGFLEVKATELYKKEFEKEFTKQNKRKKLNG